MSRVPIISVVIPHLNQPEFLSRCLASLNNQTGNVPTKEIFVVDNGSHELPHDVVAQSPNTQLLEEPIPGPGPARNRGVTAARGEILAFIDSDCIADPGWLARIAEYFGDNPDHHILGGDVYIALEDPDQVTMLEAYESVYAYRMAEYIEKQGFTGTGNLAVRTSTMDAVGTFGGKDIAEDRDWGQRAGALGFETHYVVGMIVYHPARKTFADLCHKWDRQTSHDYVRQFQTGQWRLKWLIRTVAVFVSPLLEVIRIVRSRRICGVKERLLAFGGLVRIRMYRTKIMLALLARGNASHMSGAWNRD